ncbi:MAG: YebB family permuted papain-like enzyme [Proteobacteria bacterium]|nr:YebB family permuted papain-like enzyme [Pseudomonadota bacterium]
MTRRNAVPLIRALLLCAILALARIACAGTMTEQAWLLGSERIVDATKPGAALQTSELGGLLEVGDVLFIRVTPLPFRKIAATTRSWTNHVGVVVDVSGKEPLIAESTFPLSKGTPLSRFVTRSESGRVAVARLNMTLTAQQRSAIRASAKKRAGIFYDTSFNLHSSGQFCSRFVREVIEEAVGVKLGSIETFSQLLAQNPDADRDFWKLWFFGNIPWQRETVTPASLLESPALYRVFDGYANGQRAT